MDSCQVCNNDSSLFSYSVYRGIERQGKERAKPIFSDPLQCCFNCFRNLVNRELHPQNLNPVPKGGKIPEAVKTL